MKFIIKDYEYYLNHEKELSKNTVTAYLKDVMQYEEFLKKYHHISSPNHIEKKHVEGFLKSLKQKHQSHTIARKLAALKSFHQFLLMEKETTDDVTKYFQTPKIEKKLPSVLSIDEVARLLDQIDHQTPFSSWI